MVRTQSMHSGCIEWMAMSSLNPFLLTFQT